GSTQNPEERLYVVSTMLSPSRLRTKHAPRWPSLSRQSRGHRSHWMRPSSVACHQRPGWFIGGASVVAEVRLLPLDHAIPQHPAAREAKVGRQAGLEPELREELPLVGQRLPHLRQ